MSNSDVKFLYKYRSLTAASASYVEKTILKSQIYFAAPSQFNDPFDCSPAPSSGISKKEYLAYLTKVLLREKPHLSRSDRRQRLKNVPTAPQSIQTIITEARDAIIKRVAVLSLSATHDHPLMWSHYADSHDGVCLRFQASAYTEFFGRAQKVHYQKERPVIDPIRDNYNTMLESMLLTKADFWDYEAEWRIFEQDVSPGVRNFPRSLLNGLIFGARISPEKKQNVLNWLGKRRENIELLQAEIDAHEFRLKIKPFS